MTRIEQWLLRRTKMIQRGKSDWNARPRGHAYKIIDGVGHDELQHHHTKRPTNGLLVYPQLLKTTFQRQMKLLIHRENVAKVGDVGKWEPPHFKTLLPRQSPTGSKCNWTYSINGCQRRNVLWRKHHTDRLRGEEYLGWLAWVYFRKTTRWPPWDPKSRTPVDDRDIGPDDDWTHHY